MRAVTIKVQVYCVVSKSWISYEQNKYRLYLDNDLLTERTWIWSGDIAINEIIWTNLIENSKHIIKIDPIMSPRSVIKFGLRNLTIDDNFVDNLDNDKQELSFEL